MQLGFVSAILGELSLEEVLACAQAEGFGCVELMCWPPGGADRRYAGVCHLDVTSFTKDRAARVPRSAPALQRQAVQSRLLSQSTRSRRRTSPGGCRPSQARYRCRHATGPAGRQHIYRPRSAFVGRGKLAAGAKRLAGTGAARRGSQHQAGDRELPDAILERRMARRQEPGRVAQHLGDPV